MTAAQEEETPVGAATKDAPTGDDEGTESMPIGESLVDSPIEATKDPAGKINRLEAEVSELKDKLLRLYAEFDNFRKRAAKESFELMVTANARLIAKLTEVLDNFQRAFDPKHKGASPEDFEKGIKLIHARLKELLEEEGLEEIDPTGLEFDPNVHDALLQQTSGTPENRIIQTVQKGYKLKTKILVHAKVIVSKGKE